MGENLSSARQIIKRLLGLTDKQANALMPGDDNSVQGFPAVVVYFDDDNKSWAQQEYEKEMRQYGDRPLQ